MDDEKHDQLRNHIKSLENAAESVEAAMAKREPDDARDAMLGLAQRLRRAAEKLGSELDALSLPRPSGGVFSNAADLD